MYRVKTVKEAVAITKHVIAEREINMDRGQWVSVGISMLIAVGYIYLDIYLVTH